MITSHNPQPPSEPLAARQPRPRVVDFHICTPFPFAPQAEQVFRDSRQVAWTRVVRAFLLCVGACVVVLLASAEVAAHGRIHARLDAISKRIAQSPKDPSLYLRRAELYAEHRSLNEAKADLLRARKLDAKLAEVDLVSAKVLLRLDQLEPALRSAKAYLKRKAQSSEGHLVLAKTWYRMEQFQKSEKSYTAYLALVKTPTPEDYMYRARAISALGAKHLPRALASLDEGRARLGPLQALQALALDLCLQHRNYKLALARVEHLLKSVKHNERWLAVKGDVLLELGRREEAQSAYQGALHALAQRPARRRKAATFQKLEREVQAKLEEF